MSTQVDWHDEIEAAVPRAPGHLDRAAVLMAGRRALRRRRAAIGASALTGVMLVGGATWSASPGDPSSPTRGSQIATQPTASPTPPAPTPEPPQEPVRFLGNPAALTLDGDLVLAPRTDEVVERVDNPMGYGPDQGHSLAIRVTSRGRELYSLLTAYEERSGGGTSTTTVEATGDFGGWLESAKATQHTLDVANGVSTKSPDDVFPAEWLAEDAGGALKAADPSVEVVAVRGDVDLDGETVRVAELEVSGRTQFVVVRDLGDRRVDVVPGGAGFDGLEDFIRHVRRQYDLGTGLR